MRPTAPLLLSSSTASSVFPGPTLKFTTPAVFVAAAGQMVAVWIGPATCEPSGVSGTLITREVVNPNPHAAPLSKDPNQRALLAASKNAGDSTPQQTNAKGAEPEASSTLCVTFAASRYSMNRIEPPVRTRYTRPSPAAAMHSIPPAETPVLSNVPSAFTTRISPPGSVPGIKPPRTTPPRKASNAE